MAKLVLTIQANDKASESVRALKAEVQALSASLSSVKVNKDLTAQINALTKNYTAAIEAQTKLAQNTSKEAAGIETTRKGYANLITTLKTLKSQYADGVFGNLPQDAERAFKKIQEISAAFQESGKLTKEQAKAYAQLSQQLKKYTADLATVKAKNDKIVAANPFTVTQAQQIPRLIKQYSTLLTTLRNTEKYYPKGTFDTFKADLTQGQQELQALNNEFLTTGTLSQDSQVKLNNLANSYNQLNASIAQTTSTMKSSKGGLLDIVTGFAKFQISAMAVMKPLQMIRSALTSINETLVKTEDAVIALQRVLPTGSATDSEISSRLYKVAQDYGQTFENVSQIATNFARTGMSWADTIKATEAAVLALNVAELDAEEATTGLIAILSQFNLEASDLESVIDKLNKTADNFPVTTEKILAALQRTGSAASNANLTLDQTIALITALSKATGRSGENIGTALNSLIQYSSKASALDTFAALSDESAAVVERFRQGGATILDVWRQVSEEIQHLKSDQADLLDQYFATEDGEALKDALDGELQDIYTELGGVYDTANTFRKNYFIALLGNMDTIEQAMGTLGDAAGYSQSENEKYLNTYTARVNALNAQWEELANNEQGWLSFKKGLVSAGSDLLNLIKYTGGLSTTLSAAGTAAVAVFGPTIIGKLQKFSLNLQSAEGSALNLFARIGNLTNAELNLSFAQDAERVAQEALNNARVSGIGVIEAEANAEKAAAAVAEASAAKAKASAAAWTSALTVVMLVLTVASSLDSTIRNAIEKNAEAERKAREEQDAAIAKANETIEAQKQEVQSMEDVAASVENLRNVLDNSISSEEEKRAAQEKLLQIQNTLIESNNAYKDSLDLTNGVLKEQLGLIEQLTTEQLKQKAQDFLEKNKSEIAIAQSRINSESTTTTDALLSAQGWLSQYGFRDVLNKAIAGSGIGDTTSIHEDNTYTSYDNFGKRVGEGFKNGFWEGIGELTGFGSVFDSASWIGEANIGLSFSGTVEEQLAAIKKLRDYIATHSDELGLSAEEVVSITTELQNQYDALNDDAYKEAKRLNEIAQATNDWLAGTITEAEYLEKVYGITKTTADETEDWHNNIAKVTEEYDKLVEALEKLRDAEKENLDLEEKKKDYLEAQNELIKAQQALENARNEATVRRYNEATGQWEWQVDEKKVAEAEEAVKDKEENLENARQGLKDQVYDTLIELLDKEDPPTNEELVDLLNGLEDFLGSGFIEKIKAAILDNTGVDLGKPINESGNSASDNKKWTSYADAKSAGFANIRTEREFNRGGSDKEEYGDYQTYLDAMYEKYMGGTFDSGGMALGKGYMPKETEKPEGVLPPDLTSLILSPVSSERFHQFVKDAGIILETDRPSRPQPIIERIGGPTDNRVDNSGQIIFGGGLTVGADKRNASLDEILALGGIVPKV